MVKKSGIKRSGTKRCRTCYYEEARMNEGPCCECNPLHDKWISKKEMKEVKYLESKSW